MTATGRSSAEHASFQAFFHCYLREIDPGQWASPGTVTTLHRFSDKTWSLRGPSVLILALPHQKLELGLEVLYRSTVGSHHFGGVRCRQTGSPDWWPTTPFAAVQLLISELYSGHSEADREQTKTHELELLSRFSESYRNMTRYLCARQTDPLLGSDRFIASEQSLLYGHWAHPTPKSRQGMVDWAHDFYAPELGGMFRLHCFSVARSMIAQRSVCGRPAESLIRECLGLSASDSGDVMVPVHPLQASWLMHQPAVKAAMADGRIRDCGLLGPEFTATSSVRTLYHPDLPWMLKFSIPVKVTNSLRVNKFSELEAGATMARLLLRTGFSRAHPGFQVINDPAYLTVRLPGQCESGFEVILRENPFVAGRDNGIHSLAALTQGPLPHQPSRLHNLIQGLALAEGRPSAAVCRDWFHHYFDCAIEPAIALLDEHGIALEAHQQNSLLDVSAGYPRTYFYRDNQGFYLSPSYRDHLVALDPAIAHLGELFYDDDMIQDRFGYYLLFNQLFAVIHRLGADGLIDEYALLAITRDRLQKIRRSLTGAGRQFAAAVLDRPRLAYKGNLLTRIQDVDELQAELEMAVYTSIENPLALKTGRSLRETGYEVA